MFKFVVGLKCHSEPFGCDCGEKQAIYMLDGKQWLDGETFCQTLVVHSEDIDFSWSDIVSQQGWTEAENFVEMFSEDSWQVICELKDLVKIVPKRHYIKIYHNIGKITLVWDNREKSYSIKK